MDMSATFFISATTWQNQQSECAPSEDSDQPGHAPSLIRDFTVRMKKPWILSYPLNAQRILRSAWADAQADRILRWAQTHFIGFVISWLISGFATLPLRVWGRLRCLTVVIPGLRKSFHCFLPRWAFSNCVGHLLNCLFQIYARTLKTSHPLS